MAESPQKSRPTKITAKQDVFAQEYLIDLNARQAAIRAGYSEATAQEQGSRLLSNAKVAARISELQGQRAQRLQIDSDWVLKRLVSISDRCMQAEPVMVFDPVDKKMVHKGAADGEAVYEFDSAGANRATEMIGKHLGFFEEHNKQKTPMLTDYSLLSKETLADILRATQPE